jgi:hypothetical protein
MNQQQDSVVSLNDVTLLSSCLFLQQNQRQWIAPNFARWAASNRESNVLHLLPFSMSMSLDKDISYPQINVFATVPASKLLSQEYFLRKW